VNETELTLRQILSDLDCCRKSVDEILSSDFLQQDLGVDSLGVVEVLVAIEDIFSVTISDEELLSQEEWMLTVRTLTEFVDTRIRA
jgi:acyl carrier protein